MAEISPNPASVLGWSCGRVLPARARRVESQMAPRVPFFFFSPLLSQQRLEPQESSHARAPCATDYMAPLKSPSHTRQAFSRVRIRSEPTIGPSLGWLDTPTHRRLYLSLPISPTLHSTTGKKTSWHTRLTQPAGHFRRPRRRRRATSWRGQVHSGDATPTGQWGSVTCPRGGEGGGAISSSITHTPTRDECTVLGEPRRRPHRRRRRAVIDVTHVLAARTIIRITHVLPRTRLETPGPRSRSPREPEASSHAAARPDVPGFRHIL
jgi:hypothetical protein